MWLQIGAAESVLAGSALAAAFVGSLYVWKQPADRNRDHPQVIKQRLTSVLCVTTLAPFVLLAWATDRNPAATAADAAAAAPLHAYAAVAHAGGGAADNPGPWFGAWIGLPALPWHAYALAATLPLALTAILFLGPLAVLSWPSTFDTATARDRMVLAAAKSWAPLRGDAAQASLDAANAQVSGAPVTVWCVGLRAKVRELRDMWHDEELAPAAASGTSAADEREVVRSGRWILLRNLVAAPFAEEVVFRACICSLLVAGGWGLTWTVFGSPLLFGVAHLHHVIGLVRQRGLPFPVAVVSVTIQLCYTTVFGAFAGFVYVRTGHLIAPVLCHAFCNAMGLPDVSAFAKSPDPVRRWGGWAAHVAGVLLFAVCLFPFTTPSLYDNFFFA